MVVLSILRVAREKPIDRRHRWPTRPPLRFALQCVNRQKGGQRGEHRARGTNEREREGEIEGRRVREREKGNTLVS